MKNNERTVGAQSSKIGCLAVPFDSQSLKMCRRKILVILKMFQVRFHINKILKHLEISCLWISWVSKIISGTL